MNGNSKNALYTNIPLFSNISILLHSEIRSHLQASLPEYMIPSEFHALMQMPLTGNGKIDRNFLNGREDKAVFSTINYKAPDSEVEQTIANIWQELLGIEKVGIYDNFFELGGHSLLAIRLLAAIRKRLNVVLSVNDIFIYPTIAGFCERFFKDNKDTDKNKIKHLVPLKTGTKIPIYIVAGGGGTAIRFMKFAEMMDADQPVYVLQPPVESKDLKEFPDTVEEISKKFIEEILVKNPDGPYALSGHCTGGIFAFEMARQLEAMGKKVHLLAMFDTIIRKMAKREQASFKNLYHLPLKVQRLFSQLLLKLNFESFLLRKHTKQAINYKLNALKKFINSKQAKKNKYPDELQFAGLEIFNESLDLYVNACRKYSLKPYDREIVIFYAKEHYYFTDAEKKVAFKKLSLNNDTKNMWNQFAKTVKIHEIEGEHSNMFETVHGSGFAQLLQRYLDTSDS